MRLLIANKTNIVISANFILQIFDFAGKYLDLKGREVSLALIDEEKIGEINKHYRGEIGPTDCISFAYADTSIFPGKNIFGEIYLCPSCIKKQAKKHKVSFQQELKKVFVHSVLHLCGYDHKTDKQEKAMNEMTRKICSQLL